MSRLWALATNTFREAVRDRILYSILFFAVGVLLMDFPGKRQLEIRLIRIPALHRAIDWIRSKAGSEPLELPPEDWRNHFE